MSDYNEPTPFAVLITRYQGAEILAARSRSGWRLPEVAIDPCCRVAEQLTGKIKRTWGIDTYCLSVATLPAGRDAAPVRHAILELADDSDPLRQAICWVPRASARTRVEGLSEGLIEALAEAVDARSGGPFSRPGWMSRLRSWAENELQPLGLNLARGFRQLNAGDSFSLIRFETQRTAVWFKATGHPNQHELPLTVYLSAQFPGSVPAVLAIHQDWNGWLSLEVEGPPLSHASGLWAWEETARALAELQIGSIGKTEDLVRAQAGDQRLARLVSLIDPFLVRMNELMRAQQKPSPPPLRAAELEKLGSCLKQACESLDSFRLENTINHSDLNPDNVVLARHGCVFLDWAEGSVGNPLLTFEYLRQFLTRHSAGHATARDRLTQAYLRPWARLYAPSDLRRALTAAPLIAVFAYAVATDCWRSLDFRVRPAIAAYLRSLTRRMFQQSARLKEGSTAWLN